MKKIKVAHVITRMIIGGAQENTLYTVQGLERDPGYDVTLITGPTYGPEGKLMNDDFPIAFPIITVPTLRRNLNPIYDLMAFFHLLFLFLVGRYKIVHTHSAKAGILGRIAARICGVKLVIHTIHGLPFHSYQHPLKNKLFIFLEQIAAVMCDRIITVCDDMIVQCLEAKIAPKEKFQTIYSGLDIDSFRPSFHDRVVQLKEKFDLPEQAFVIGKIGRLFHLKGHQYLLEAATQVIEEAPNVYFYAGGWRDSRRKN